MHNIRLTKFDAIRAQLDAAIELFFTSDNVVATHTLVAAAYNALKDVAKREGAEHPFIKTEYIRSLPDNERSRVHKLLHEPENFFKHADRDPQGEISFNPELTELLLIDACAYFRPNEAERPKYYDALLAWAGKTKEGIPEDSDLLALVDAVRGALKSRGKQEFWNIFKQYLKSHNEN